MSRGAVAKRRGSPGSAAIVSAARIVDTTEAAEPLDARPQGRQIEECARVLLYSCRRATASSIVRRYARWFWSSAGSGQVWARSHASGRFDHAFVVAVKRRP